MSTSRPLLADAVTAVPVDQVDDAVKLRADLDDLRDEFEEFKSSVERDRNKLGSMLHAIRAVFGGADGAAPTAGSSIPQPTPSAAYDAWKQRLPPSCGRVIDALLVQPMGYTQLKNFCKMGQSTLDQALAKLRANGLIEKDGTLNRLRRP